MKPMSTFSLSFLLLSLSMQLLTAASATTISLSAAVAEGNAHFRSECAKQQALMPELLAALEVNDLSRAVKAYTAARPPYEQIETLANVFPTLDAAIDARPYIYRFGEDDTRFQGFHVIERALYRDQRLDAQLFEYGLRLNESVNLLCDALTDMSRFTPHAVFEGSVALAFEVPYKKVASEEETWSGLSLMIFRNNYIGVWSQVSPFFRTGKVSAATQEKAEELYEKVKMLLEEIDPDNAFDTAQGTARPYSEVTFEERGRIIHLAYEFAVAMEAVQTETLAGVPEPSPEPDAEESPPENAIPSGKFVDEVKQGLQYFLAECRRQQALFEPLFSALRSDDLPAAQKAYAAARPPYEQIETLAGDFAELDRFIDGRPYVYARGELDEGWRGMHEIERDLYRDGDIPGALGAAAVVKDDVDALCAELERGLNAEPGTTFSAENTFNGMITLAYEVPGKKIASEEETWSDLSIMIFRENLKGIWSQFAPFKPHLSAETYGMVLQSYHAMRSFIQYVADPENDFEVGVNFAKYSMAPVWQRKTFSDGFYALGRALRTAREELALA